MLGQAPNGGLADHTVLHVEEDNADGRETDKEYHHLSASSSDNGSGSTSESDEASGSYPPSDNEKSPWDRWSAVLNVRRRSRRAASGAAAALRQILDRPLGCAEVDERTTRQSELEELRMLTRQRDVLNARVQEKRRHLGLRAEPLADVLGGPGGTWSDGTPACGVAGEDKVPAEYEERWEVEGVRRNIIVGSKILIGFNVGICGSRVLFHMLQAATCGHWAMPSGPLREGVGVIVLTLMFGSCIYWPSSALYYPALVVYMIFVLLHGFRPLVPSCEEIHVRWECGEPMQRCRLAGYTFMQLQITWVLLTPWFIPQLEMMHFLWAKVWLMFVMPIFWEQRTSIVSYHQKVDVLWSVLFLSSINFMAIAKKKYLERTRRAAFIVDLKEGELSRKMFELLGYMVPAFVIVPMLKEPGKVIANQVDRASVLFIIFADFEQRAKIMSPQHLLEFLNRHFTEFDRICAANNVTKIETVGEEYVCAVGVVPEDAQEDQANGHRTILGRLLAAACEILDLQYDCGVTGSRMLFQMGMHTGPILAGVTSQKLPRYRLFGDTINTAARMMQKGLPGELQFGEATYRELPEGVRTRSRGQIEMKGKGQVTVYLLQRQDHGLERQDAWLTFPSMRPQEPPRRSRSSSPGRLGLQKQGGLMARLLQHLGVEASTAFRGNSATHDFEEVVLQMHRGAPRDIPEGRRDRLLATLWKTVTPGWCDFPEHREEAFLAWFHEECILHHLGRRLAYQALFVATLTLVEVSLLQLHVSSVVVDPQYPEGPPPVSLSQLRAYLLLRLASLVVIASWGTKYRSGDLRRNQPRPVQLGLLLSSALVATLVFISYLCLPPDPRPPSQQRLRVPSYSTVSFVQLMCVPVFTLATTSYPTLFLPSCTFVLLAGGLMALHSALVPEDQTIFSELSMFAFVLTSMLHTFGSWCDECLLRKRFSAKEAMEVTRGRMESILNTLMPPLVVEELRSTPLHMAPPSHRYLRATIVQSDLVGFTSLASRKKPTEVVEFIGDLFGRFDDLTDLHEVYKVETVGDAYIAGQAEVPLTVRNSPLSVVLLGLDMVEATRKWSEERGEQVTCRVGVHSGECVGGIIGSEMQRYHLFGKLMAQVCVLEATASASRVQVSTACKDAVEADFLGRPDISRQGFEFEPRNLETLVTSKGESYGCEEVGGPTFLAKSDAKFRAQVVLTQCSPTSRADTA